MSIFSYSSFDRPMEDQKMVVMLPIDSVSLTCGTQIRSVFNESAVLRYASLMDTEEGRAKFPPIIVYRDEHGNQWIADGHHRVMAAIRCQLTEIRAEIRPGTKADALWTAAEINSKNGLPLEGEDIRQTVIMLLEAWPNRSLRAIAEAVGCSKSYVGLIKNQVFTHEHLANDTSLLSGKTIGKDGKLYPAIRLKKPKDDIKPDDGIKDDSISNPGNTTHPQTVVTVSLSPHSPPTASVSNTSPEDHETHPIQLTQRQRVLKNLYLGSENMDELVEDILATFADRHLFNLPFTVFDKVVGNWKWKPDAERLLCKFIGVRFMRADDNIRNRILRDIFERLFDDNETISELMDSVKAKRDI